ncbi:hypothetical protein TRFO_31954 [Tritrichomonas foetus]|uniref:HMG box domain-containing protein n=1 Tax=Tritrichomonas foetus TaxID=1144522 RepID=A0A1J4JUT0_9EUKA|nr:hypothetical protein TRFO_31954 [Tritrichomonas foetus]|eukprot:OHT01278.1 hypothetical protein TRFO_31954 [Tritrichomonas foetus]
MNDELNTFSPRHHQKKKEKCYKRPPNAFILFSREMRPSLIQKCPNMAPSDVSSLLSHLWRSLDPNKKQNYKIQAANLLESENAINFDKHKNFARKHHFRYQNNMDSQLTIESGLQLTDQSNIVNNSYFSCEESIDHDNRNQGLMKNSDQGRYIPFPMLTPNELYYQLSNELIKTDIASFIDNFEDPHNLLLSKSNPL